MNRVKAELIERSRRLGSNPANTNYGGGNTSAKGFETDPLTGEQVPVLFVKGSGGDLGSLEEKGVATLRLDRFSKLVDVYRGEQFEDEMVTLFDECKFDFEGPPPSIDTAMHALVQKNHVDHLHPDSGIALATATSGEEETKKIFGDQVLWVGWRRPGFQLGVDIAKLQEENPQAIGVILEGHGITAWGESSKECEENSLKIISMAAEHLSKLPGQPFGKTTITPLEQTRRKEIAALVGPTIRGLASSAGYQVGTFSEQESVLEFVSSEKLNTLSSLGTSCPDHFLRTKVKPLVLAIDFDLEIESLKESIRKLFEQYRADYDAYYQRNAEEESPKMRGSDPAIVLIPGVGMFSFGANKQTSRIAGEFYLNAINVMRGAEAISGYQPINEFEKFRIEYWSLEEAKLQRLPKPKPLAGRIALVTGSASGIGKATAERLVAEGACVVIADLNIEAATEVASSLGRDVAVGVQVDVSNPASVKKAFEDSILAFGGMDIVVNNAGLSLSKSLADTSEADWDKQFDVMSKGSFLVSQEAARIFEHQGIGGNIIYISSKNSVFAGPNNIAYAAAKASQAHQVRLLAAELGDIGVRVNGINPDGVVAGSGIFAGGWGAKRAEVYGVKEEDLGKFYAQRTLLKQEVLPVHVANAVFALCSSDLSHTTGVHIPVDAGVPAAFLR